MNITFEGKPTYEELYEQVWVVSGDVKRLFSAKRLIQVFLFCGAALYMSWATELLVAGVVLSALVLGFVFKKKKQIDSILDDLKQKSLNGPTSRIEITEEGIKIENTNSRHQLKWESFESYYETENVCHIFTDKINGIAIPFSQIEDKIPRTEFVEFVRSKVVNKFIRRNKRL